MKGHVDASGFPLQIGLMNAVNQTHKDHNWKTLYSEHAWKNSDTNEMGFIDLVVSNAFETQFLVVECKRVKDTSWIFLKEKGAAAERRHAKSFVFSKDNAEVKRFGWCDLTLCPATAQSQFCVIPGTDNRSKSLIERTAAELVSSTEGLASEFKYLSLNDRLTLKIFFNVIVTTAKLQVCEFDALDIDLSDGTIGDADFSEVPFLRFRKQLSPMYSIPEIFAVTGSTDIAQAKENTVFVVNSNHFIDFLKEFEIDEGMSNNRYFR